MKDIQLLLPSIKIKYVKSMSTCKIKEYVRMVNETEGAKEARATLSYAVLVKAMYLNLVISVAVYKGEMESISVDVEQFNSGLKEMEQVFIAIEGEGSRKKIILAKTFCLTQCLFSSALLQTPALRGPAI